MHTYIHCGLGILSYSAKPATMNDTEFIDTE